MSNEQLALLLSGLLDELDAAIDRAREAMPDSAERETSQEWLRKPEYAGEWLFVANEKTCDLVTVEGDYLALLPLKALRDAWRERFGILESEASDGR